MGTHKQSRDKTPCAHDKLSPWRTWLQGMVKVSISWERIVESLCLDFINIYYKTKVRDQDHDSLSSYKRGEGVSIQVQILPFSNNV